VHGCTSQSHSGCPKRSRPIGLLLLQ